MSSVSDHVQLIYPKKQNTIVFLTNANGYISMIPPPNTTKEHPSLRQPVFPITPNFWITIRRIFPFHFWLL